MSTGNFGTGAWDDGGWQAAKASQLPCGNPSGRADQFNSVLRRHFGSKKKAQSHSRHRSAHWQRMMSSSSSKDRRLILRADDISVELDGDSFVPVSALNELRRETLDALTEKLQDRQKEHMFQNTAGKQKQRSPEAGESTATAAAMPPPSLCGYPASAVNSMLCLCPAGRAGICLRCARRAQIGCTFLRI